MDDSALTIIKALMAGDFFLSLHAAGRMKQRSIAKADIQACGRTAKSCVYQPENGNYRVLGEDIDGETLTVVCTIDMIVIIVTIF
jgi:hypothetical protein